MSKPQPPIPQQTPPPPQQGHPPQQGGYPPPPPQGYAPPPQGYAPPPQGYPPQPGYAPQQGYPQQGGYPPPQHGYPPQGYASPPQGYAPPPQGYAPPPQGYAPQPGYGAPPPAHGYPQPGYAPPPVHAPPPMGPPPTAIVVPPGHRYVADANATLKIRLISAKNLEAADSNGKSDPFVKFLQGHHATTSRVIDKNLNPVWNDNLSLSIVRPQSDILVIEVYDKDTLSNDLLGLVGIDLAYLPKDREVVTNEKLTCCKHGEVQLGLTATGFGIENVPPGYVEHYQHFRNSIAVKPKDKNKTKDKKKDKSKKKTKPPGQFVGKNPPEGYSLKNGVLKKKKSEAQKALKLGKKGGKGVLSFAKALI